MRAINVLLSVVVSALLALLVLEGGLRLLGFAPPKSINQFDAQLGWSKRPGAKAHKKTSEYDVRLKINELGLRDDEMRSPAKPANTFRVVCLGDSFTLGYTVERHDLFVDQLEGWWNGESRRVDVVNAGTEGYSTDQEVVWLMEHGEEFQPDLVLLFPYENDIYWNGQTEYFGKPKPRFASSGGELEQRTLVEPPSPGWWEHTALHGFLAQITGSANAGAEQHFFTPEGGARPILKEWGALLPAAPGFITDAVTRTGSALQALKAECDELGARLIVVPIPSRSAIEADYAPVFGRQRLGIERERWSPDLPIDTFLELCRLQGIDGLDCRPTLRAHAEEGAALYYEHDWHLNAEGNRAFATWLHHELDSRGAFPESHGAIKEGGIPEPSRAKGIPTWFKVYGALWVLLTAMYTVTYKDEPRWQPPVKVALMLGAIFAIVIGGGALVAQLPPHVAKLVLPVFLVAILGFVFYKLGRKIGTILELFRAFTLRGHWYLMPLVVVLLTIGSLLVVAASSPFVAPFIYTLF